MTEEKEKLCAVDGCDREAIILRHKLCQAHYLRYIKTGDPGKSEIRKKKKIKPYQDNKET